MFLGANGLSAVIPITLRQSVSNSTSESKSGRRTDGVQLLSILLGISITVGMTLGFNVSWWIGVLAGIGTMVGLVTYIRLAADDGLLSKLAKWILRE